MKLLNAKDVGSLLGVSPVTVLRLADSGELPAVQIAQRERKRIIRFRQEAVEKFIASRERRANTAA